MQRQTWVLAGAFCAGLFLFNAPLAAQSSMGSQSSMTDAQVTAKVQAAGYTNVHGVEHEGDHYDVDAMKNGKAVHLHVDAKSGTIAPAPRENEEENEEYGHHRQ